MSSTSISNFSTRAPEITRSFQWSSLRFVESKPNIETSTMSSPIESRRIFFQLVSSTFYDSLKFSKQLYPYQVGSFSNRLATENDLFCSKLWVFFAQTPSKLAILHSVLRPLPGLQSLEALHLEGDFLFFRSSCSRHCHCNADEQ